jgi:radical SAM superfamily enzyme YgiQ (UPF0313 family)
VKWICYVRGDMFNDAHAELMSRAGCHQVLMGVESGSSTLMAKIGKPIQKDKYIKAVKTAHKYGIEVRASFIIGHMDETYETMRETVDFAKDMDVDFFQLSMMTPYPGTIMFKDVKKRGLLIHEDYARYGQSEMVMRLANLQPEEVLAFERRSFYMFYMRPIAIYRQLRRLTNWAQFRDLIKAAYIIGLEGIGATSEGSVHLQEWLAFDLASVLDKSVKVPEEAKLTYEVRQNPEYEPAQ